MIFSHWLPYSNWFDTLCIIKEWEANLETGGLVGSRLSCVEKLSHVVVIATHYTIGIKIRRWAFVQIYSWNVGVCCKSWGRQGQRFATNTVCEVMNLYQHSVAGLYGYYIAGLSDRNVLQLCENDTKIQFSNEPGLGPDSPCAVSRDHFKATETLLNILCFPSYGIFIATCYNLCPIWFKDVFGWWTLKM